MSGKSKRIIVVGGGAAGMMAAAQAAKNGCSVLLAEKNEKLGKKLFITGKGRCNVTNGCETEEYFRNIPHNASFCYSALYSFTPDMLISLIEENGTPLKKERGNRVFPVSDKSSDILKALARLLERTGVEVHLHTTMEDLLVADGHVTGVRLNGQVRQCDAVVLALGGASYPSTGSTGAWKGKLEALGHTVMPFRPALVPLRSDAEWVRDLTGLSLKNVTLRAVSHGRVLYEELGEMLFTHFGISGPLVLTLSSMIRENTFPELQVTVDLKPGLHERQLDERLQRDFRKYGSKTLKNAMTDLLPSRLISPVITLSGLNGSMPVSQLSGQGRAALCRTLKALPVPVSNFCSLEEAIITRGGVQVKEIDPGTMESKIIKGLYFAGEMVDIDALTGGFNLQLAFSTGFLAGEACGGNYANCT